MDKPKLSDFKRKVYDGEDYADWYQEYYVALEKYTDHLESQLTASRNENEKSLLHAKAIKSEFDIILEQNAELVRALERSNRLIKENKLLLQTHRIRKGTSPYDVAIRIEENETALRSAGQQTEGE